MSGRINNTKQTGEMQPGPQSARLAREHRKPRWTGVTDTAVSTPGGRGGRMGSWAEREIGGPWSSWTCSPVRGHVNLPDGELLCGQHRARALEPTLQVQTCSASGQQGDAERLHKL